MDDYGNRGLPRAPRVSAAGDADTTYTPHGPPWARRLGQAERLLAAPRFVTGRIFFLQLPWSHLVGKGHRGICQCERASRQRGRHQQLQCDHLHRLLEASFVMHVT